MDEGGEIRFIDLFSGIGGFRLGLERANEERRLYRRQDMHGRRADIDECVRIRHISQEPPRGGEIGLERCNDIGSRQSGTQGRRWNEDKETIPDKHSSQFTSKGGSHSRKLCGFRCVWSCDNNKYANQIYAKHFGEANHHSGDIRGVNAEDIPDFDLLCAGFPCQSFSVAGPRTGFQDTRGTLFFEISRIAEAKRPQMLLLENVKGLLSNDRGQTFQTILQELGRIGYWAEWQILNSKHHGVPQNRERVFIIGHSRNGRTRPIFPIGEADEVAKRESRGRPKVQPEVSTAINGSYYKGVDRHGQRTIVLDTFNRGAKEEEAYSLKTNPSPTSSAVIALRQIGTLGKDDQASRVYSPKGLSPTIPTPGGGHHMPKIVTPVLRPKDDWFSQHAIYPPEGVGPTLRGNQNDPAPRIVMPVLTPDRAEKRQHGRRFKEHGEPAFTLTGQDIHGVAISFTNPHDSEEERKVNLSDTTRTVKPPYGNQQPLILHENLSRHISVRETAVALRKEASHNYQTILKDFRIRRLTPCECERLQGFPDGWTSQGICKKGDTVWTGKYRNSIEIDEDGLEVTRYRPIMTKAKTDGIYPITDTNRYKCLGNAVTTSVITFLGKRIMEAEKEAT